MNLVLITDIFGITAHLLKISKQLNAQIIDPYAGALMHFSDEATAYAYFSNNIGLDCYLDIVSEKFEQLDTVTVAIGFSVGASVLWRYGADDLRGKLQRGYCFYGSQIRNYLQLVPNYPLQLILPKHEPHFSVAQLAADLAGCENLTIIKTEYLHGFMNQCSVNYDHQACQKHLQLLKEKYN
ncbi:MAG: hypothetical protein OFPI_11780 [Osedax symbiont Rs2]|nr:MAG: hypothetical protein OFPI_11780 [Osedax symbiont Rs2]